MIAASKQVSYERQAAIAIAIIGYRHHVELRQELGISTDLFIRMMQGERIRNKAQNQLLQRAYHRLTTDYNINPIWLFLDDKKPMTL